jgi:hypothetical protein
MSTLYTGHEVTDTSSQITVPTGQKIVGTDTASIVAPGQVIQIQSTNMTTHQTVTGTTFTVVDLGFLTSITPSATSSKIMVNLANYSVLTRDASTVAKLFLQRRINNGSWSNICGIANYAGQGGSYEAYPNAMHIDSPNTTSQVDYRLIGQRFGGSSSVAFHHDNNDTPELISTLTAMEIAQ